jgi:hypothetical protein
VAGAIESGKLGQEEKELEKKREEKKEKRHSVQPSLLKTHSLTQLCKYLSIQY